MSSSGKGQSTGAHARPTSTPPGTTRRPAAAPAPGRVIVEGFVDFDYEITLLTVRHAGGTSFCEPIGHLQRDGDYRESWQPQPMSPQALERAQEIAQRGHRRPRRLGRVRRRAVRARATRCGSREVSPRPHDTGLVTLVSQDLSEFALHARAILGLPIPAIRQLGPVGLVRGARARPWRAGVRRRRRRIARSPTPQLRLFGKPRVEGHRRVGVTLARGADIDEARAACARCGRRHHDLRLERHHMSRDERHPKATSSSSSRRRSKRWAMRSSPTCAKARAASTCCATRSTRRRAARNDDRSAGRRRSHGRAGTDGPAVDGAR